ncbi:hypothetical protein D3C72_2546030 [compost metagenome]
MLRHAVIPNGDVIFLPAPAHLELRLGNVSKQEVQQRVTFLRCQINNSGRETFVDEQRLPAADRVGTYHRVQ